MQRIEAIDRCIAARRERTGRGLRTQRRRDMALPQRTAIGAAQLDEIVCVPRGGMVELDVARQIDAGCDQAVGEAQQCARRTAGADDAAIVVIGEQAAAAVARHGRDPGVAEMIAEDRALHAPRRLHRHRKRELMRGAFEVLAAGGDVDGAGEPPGLVEQRRHRAGEHVPLRAKMLVAMHQDRLLLGERGAEPVGAFEGLGEIRAGVDLPVHEHLCVGFAGQAAEQHGRVHVSEIDAIAGVAQHAGEIVELGRDEPDRLLHRLGDVTDLRLR